MKGLTKSSWKSKITTTSLFSSQLKEATAEEAAENTNRTRGLENLYLNQLERMGYIERIKRGKRIHFRTLRII